MSCCNQGDKCDAESKTNSCFTQSCSGEFIANLPYGKWLPPEEKKKDEGYLPFVGATKISPDFPIEPILDRIYVEKDSSQVKGGLHLPDTIKGRAKTGLVVAAGPGRLNTENGRYIPLAVKAGDRVFLKEYDGYRFECNGKTYFIFTENEIIGKVVGDIT